ncbi:MAG: OstA-like protein [Lutibacter sp.]|nr:OstA-like protein [Lutibacter sp.]
MKKLLFFVIIFISISGFSQTKKIKILKADNTFTDPKFPEATISMGNVFIEHEGATLRCDKAYIYQERKLVKAMGNVVINQGDTIVQTSKYADYDANSKIATSWGNVVLKDDMMTLQTDTLKFNRETQQLYYKSGGTITDATNVLKSRIGDYYLRTKKFQAFTNVEVTNIDSKVVSNHLDYYTNTGIADLHGPSTITSKQNSIYTEKGHHNSKTNISHFLKNSKIFYNDRTIEGDSLYYNKNIEFASATGNIIVVDTINASIIKGGYAEYFKLKDSVFITKKAVAISIIEKDSVFIHGDKLMVTGKVEDRIVRAFNRVKFFKSDLQGKCDSLITFEKTGLTKLLVNPVMWTQGNQITGDTIYLISNPKTEQLDSLKILNNAFMVQKDSAGYSQLKGKFMYGKFKNNALKSLDVVGNSEVIFYVRNDLQELVGITRMKSSRNIFITMENNEIETIDFIEKPDGKTYPPSKLPKNEEILKGFIWREKERPLNKEGIFIYDDIDAKKTDTKVKAETKEKEVTKN